MKPAGADLSRNGGRAGRKVTTPLMTQWWGDRTFTVVDPYGYQIWFHQKQVAEMKPPAGAKLV